MEPEDVQDPGSARVAVTTRDLLTELGVLDRPRPDQERAVQAWLAQTRPNKVLAAALRRDGFGAGQRHTAG